MHSGVIERVTSGWLELTALLPDSSVVLTDLRALELNARLRGSSRIARVFGSSRPFLRADVCVDRPGSRSEWTASSCEDFRAVASIAAGSGDALPVPVAIVLQVADVERACAETGWRALVTDGSVRVDVPARYAMHVARLESSPHAGPRFVIDLVNLAGRPEVCRSAVAALLLAVSGSVRMLKGAIVERGDGCIAALMSPLEAVSGPAVDEALMALSVACEGTVREVEALMDERLAAEYLALSCGASRETAPEPMEEDLCLQQP